MWFLLLLLLWVAAPVYALTVDRYLTTAEVAERFRTVPATVRYWKHVGYGPKGIKVGRKVLYPAAEVERFEVELHAEQDVDQNGVPAA